MNQDLSNGLDDVTKNQRSMYVAVFEGRYDGAEVVAMVAFNWPLVSYVEGLFQGDYESEFCYINKLLDLDWYPIAAGATYTEAVAALDKKLRRIPLMSAGPEFGEWLRYVGILNGCIPKQLPIDTPIFRNFKLETANAPDT